MIILVLYKDMRVPVYSIQWNLASNKGPSTFYSVYNMAADDRVSNYTKCLGP